MRTTSLPATPSSSSVCAAPWPAGPPPTITYSGTCELRSPFLDERRDALRGVLALDQLRHSGALAGEPVLERPVHALVGGELDLADGAGRAGGQALRELERLPGRLVGREQAVEDAQAVRLAGR